MEMIVITLALVLALAIGTPDEMSARKTRDDARLDKLPEDLQEAVFTHCEKVKLEDGARWLKSEFDIELSPQRLGKWLEKVRNANEFSELLSQIRRDAESAELVGQAIGDAANLHESNTTLLSQALFHAQRTKNPVAMKLAAEALSTIMTAVAKRDAAKASVISAETARNRFQFDAAKLALVHAAELQEIQRSTGSEREKVERAVARLFGRQPKTV